MAEHPAHTAHTAHPAHTANWAGNIEFAPRSLHSPTSVTEVQRIVTGHDTVRALGTGHSFNRIADTPGALLKTDRLPRDLEVDREHRTARVGAGIRFSELSAALRPYGLALPNLPSTPHFTLAGAYATGTHGSGNANGMLATAVSAVELVTADGALTTVNRGGQDFDGAVTSLGALGIVTAVTLDLVPAFEVEQYVYQDLAWQTLTEHPDDLFAAAYSVSVFTDWTSDFRVWVKRRTCDPLPDLGWTGARPADRPQHPINGVPTANVTEQLGVPGPWDERLPHFRAGFMPSAGAELQSEYLVPRANAIEALKAVGELNSWISPVLQVSELRTVAGDTQWLSPAHGRDSLAFHFTWVPDAPAIAPVLLRIEEALAPFDPRPHWGKVSATPPETLAASYPHWNDFHGLLRSYDPSGTFRNAYIDHYFPHTSRTPHTPA
jgi:alditol oxidase